MHLRDLLEQGGWAPHKTLEAHCRLREAAEFMCEKGAPPVIVTRNGLPAGVLSRRDLISGLMGHPAGGADEGTVGEAMNPKLMAAGPEDRVDETLAMMTAAGLRHVPVIEDGRVHAVLPVEALFASRVEGILAEMQYLQEYIADLQDAAHD